MKEVLKHILTDQRFLVGAWVLQTLWYLVLRIMYHQEIVGGPMTVILCGQVILLYLVPIYTLAFIAYGFVLRQGTIRYKAIPVLTFLLCYIGQTGVYWIIDRAFG